MKLYKEFSAMCFLLYVFISGCVFSTHSNSNKVIQTLSTDIATYNRYKEVIKTDLNIRDKIGVLVELSYFGYESHPEECLKYIKTAMMYSNKIDHDHDCIAKLFILYAKLHKLLNKDYKPLYMLKKGERILGHRISRELKRRNPYKKQLDRFSNHQSYVWEVNKCKKYMRNAGYNVGKDKRVSIFWGISRAILLKPCITVMVLPFELKNGGQTLSLDIYYHDFISYYLDLAKDGFDITQIPNHRFACFY